jgi:hypothetical protein
LLFVIVIILKETATVSFGVVFFPVPVQFAKMQLDNRQLANRQFANRQLAKMQFANLTIR